MVQGETPVVRQRRLRAALRRFREDADHTQKSVAQALGWSTSKVIRIETGVVSISTSDLRALLHFYDITDVERSNDLLAITREKEASWWDALRDEFGPQFVKYLAYEHSANRIRTFMGLVVPGLLQTEQYMRTLFAAYQTDQHDLHMTDNVDFDRGVEVRLRRQELLARESGPELFVILDEAVIHRMVGGPDVMRAQLLRLKEAAEHPRVDLRIVPFSYGSHHGMSDSFAIFEFPSDVEDYVVYVENPHRNTQLRDDPEFCGEYVTIFSELEDIASHGAEAIKIIDSVLESLPATGA